MGFWRDTGAPYKDTRGRWQQNRTFVASEGEGCNSVQVFPVSEPRAALKPAEAPAVVARTRDIDKILGLPNLNSAEMEILRKSIEQAVTFHAEHGRWRDPGE